MLYCIWRAKSLSKKARKDFSHTRDGNPMKITIYGKQMTVRESLKLAIEKKLMKFDKFFGESAEAFVTCKVRKGVKIIEITVNYGSAIMKYADLQPGDLLIIFHNIGINPATIDAAMEAKKNGVKIIAVSSIAWQTEMPEDHFIRHPNKTNLNDYADVCIEDFNPVGDAVVTVPGLDTPIAPISNIVDFYIAHLLEIETVKQCIDRGIKPPVWSSANTPGGDEKNAAYLEKYRPRVKML